MGNILTTVIGGVIEPVVRVVENRAERKTKERLAKLDADSKKMELASKVAADKATAAREGKAYEASWEELAWKHSGWKDEFWTIWAGTMIAAQCIPVVGVYVQEGLAATQLWPVEFRYAVVALILSSIGIRWKNGK